MLFRSASGRPSDVESPAAKAGMESGDIILVADGKRVDRVSTLQRILRAHQPGDVVTLEGVRYGEKKSYKVKLVEAPSDEARTVADNPHKDAEESTDTAALAKVGITVEGISAKVAEARSISDKLKGVVVTKIGRAHV